jgi:trk/ktr system potassium uptake protein
MKIIIMGCGRVGATLASLMIGEKFDVTIIDTNPSAFTRLAPDFRGTKIAGDGTDEDVLRRAGIEQAQCFAAVTNGDNRNIMAAQIAKHIFHVPRVICRIYDPIRQEVYHSLGLDSICPTVVGAQMIHDALIYPERGMASPELSLAEGRAVPTKPILPGGANAMESGAANGVYQPREQREPGRSFR